MLGCLVGALAFAGPASAQADGPPRLPPPPIGRLLSLSEALEPVFATPPPSTAYRWGGSENVGMPASVPTCWENPEPNHQPYRSIVRSAVRATWEAHSGISFVGWGPCAAGSRGIRILVADPPGPDAIAGTIGIGSQLDGRPNGVRLNFTFQNWNNHCAEDEAARRECIYTSAVHEFGRALGIEDSTGMCQVGGAVAPPIGGTVAVACVPPDYAFGGTGLSPYDAYASAYLYGPPVE